MVGSSKHIAIIELNVPLARILLSNFDNSLPIIKATINIVLSLVVLGIYGIVKLLGVMR